VDFVRGSIGTIRVSVEISHSYMSAFLCDWSLRSHASSLVQLPVTELQLLALDPGPLLSDDLVKPVGLLCAMLLDLTQRLQWLTTR
jgi:hypothetical protein